MDLRAAVAVLGFLLLGLSPSFIDWQQASADQRTQILVYYLIALSMIYVGVIKHA